MDRGKCKAPKATATLCAFAPVSGSAPVLVSAFGASADTSRRQEMQIGDLVVFRNGLVPGVIVAEEGNSSDQRNHRLGVIWMDYSDKVRWYPPDPTYLRVISETENENR